MRIVALLTMLLAFPALSQDRAETKELYGTIGGRNALLVLQATQRADGGWQVAGEYVLLPTMVRRYVEGERSPEIGVTTLKEGTSPILFGRHGGTSHEELAPAQGVPGPFGIGIGIGIEGPVNRHLVDCRRQTRMPVHVIAGLVRLSLGLDQRRRIF